MVECSTWDRRVASSRLTEALCCVFEQDTLLSTGSTQEDREDSVMAEKLLTGV